MNESIICIPNVRGFFFVLFCFYWKSCVKPDLCPTGGFLWLHRWHPLLHFRCGRRHLPQRQLCQADFLVGFQFFLPVQCPQQSPQFDTHSLSASLSLSLGMTMSMATATVLPTCWITCTPRSRRFLSSKEVRNGTSPVTPPSPFSFTHIPNS